MKVNHLFDEGMMILNCFSFSHKLNKSAYCLCQHFRILHEQCLRKCYIYNWNAVPSLGMSNRDQSSMYLFDAKAYSQIDKNM